MHKWFGLMLLASGWSCAVQSHAVENATVENPAADKNLAIWGDSLTNGLFIPSNMSWIRSGLPGYNVYNGGVGGNTSTQIKDRMSASPDKLTYTTVIWAGYNDLVSPPTVEADITSMVKLLGTNNHYVILSILTGDIERKGSMRYTNTMAINRWIATTYPDHYYDVRTYLVSLYNPADPQDVADHDADIVPHSLRIDHIHLTGAGYVFVGEKIAGLVSGMQLTHNNGIAK